jgi:hypothetical protein
MKEVILKKKLTLWNKIKLVGHFIINHFRSAEALEKENEELRKKLEYYEQLIREQASSEKKK